MLSFLRGGGRDKGGSSGKAVHQVPWHKDPKGFYPRLLGIRVKELGLEGVSGVYILWHGGNKPRWIHVGATDNLGQALEEARDDMTVLNWEGKGGVFATWAPFKAEFQAGVVTFLRNSVPTLVEKDFPADKPVAMSDQIPVTLPS